MICNVECTGLLLYPCLPWYDASDEWLFVCSGDATQSDAFPTSHLENTSKNQVAQSKKSPVQAGDFFDRLSSQKSHPSAWVTFLTSQKKSPAWTMTGQVNNFGPRAGSTWSSARGPGTTLPQTEGFNP